MNRSLQVTILTGIVGVLLTVSMVTDNENTGVLIATLGLLINQIITGRGLDKIESQTNGLLESKIVEAVRRADDPPDSVEWRNRQ